jgi:hypothetical protein
LRGISCLIKKLNNKRDRKEVAIGIPLPVNTIRSMMWSRRVAGAVEPAKFVHPSTFTGARFPFFFFTFSMCLRCPFIYFTQRFNKLLRNPASQPATTTHVELLVLELLEIRNNYCLSFTETGFAFGANHHRNFRI